MEREFHNSILVKNGFIYCSNGFYLVKVKAIAIEDGCYKIAKDKNEINLIPQDVRWPDVEQLDTCNKYGDPVVFYGSEDIEHISRTYTSLARALPEDICLNFGMFEQIVKTRFFDYWQTCQDEGNNGPIKLISNEENPDMVAYIMPMRS